MAKGFFCIDCSTNKYYTNNVFTLLGCPEKKEIYFKHFEENDIEKITKTFWDTQDMYHVLFVV